MNLLRTYSKITTLAFRSRRAFAASNKRSPNTTTDTKNPSGSNFDKIYDKPIEPLSSSGTVTDTATGQSEQFNSTSNRSNTFEDINRSQTRSSDNSTSDFASSAKQFADSTASNIKDFTDRTADTAKDFVDRTSSSYNNERRNREDSRRDQRDTNNSPQDFVNAAANIASSTIKGFTDAAGSVVSNFVPGAQTSSNRDRYDDRNPNNATNVVGSAVQGLANAAVNVASSFIPGNQGNRNDSYGGRGGVTETIVNYAVKGVTDAAGSVVSNFIPGGQASDRRGYEDNRFGNDMSGNIVNTAASAARGFTDAAKGFADVANSIASTFVAGGQNVTGRASTGAQDDLHPKSTSKIYGKYRPKSSSYEIIISGGGVNGGALACAVGHSQYFGKDHPKILLLDPHEPPLLDEFHMNDTVPDQRVVSLSLASVNFLRELGVWSLLNHTRLGIINQMQVWEVGGNSFIKFNDNPSQQIGFVVENAHLQAAIYERLRALGNIEICVAHKIVDVRTDPNSFATVTLDNNDLISARLVVGSDGTNSVVRNKARISTTGWSSNQQGVVCTVKTERHNTTAWQRFLTTGPLAVLPLWDEYNSIVWSCDNQVYDTYMKCSDEEFLEELNYNLNRKPLVNTPNFVVSSSAGFDYPPRITEICNKRRSFPLGMQQANQFVTDRIALIGDAAHNVHPLAGQGLNLGLSDASNLANVIVRNLKAGNDIGRQEILREYETSSMNINKTMMYGLEFIKRSYETNQYDAVVLARNLATSFINNLTPMKSLFVDIANGKYFQPSDYEWKRK